MKQALGHKNIKAFLHNVCNITGTHTVSRFQARLFLCSWS